jgi:putative flippase GtrA
VPTKNEVDNIEPLLTRIRDAIDSRSTEVLFVDDSDDDTPQCIEQLREQFPFDVSLIARPPQHRKSGLGGAVVEGFKAGRGTWLCVMDGDLQHPPELIPRLLRQAQKTEAQLTLASRFISGATAAGLGRSRSLISYLLTLICHMLFPKRLRGITDPLTGMFMIRRDALDLTRLRPNGFKILLEILVRFPHLHVSEIPFIFGRRTAGKTKAGAREVLRLFRLLIRLQLSQNQRFYRFLAVGASGFVVNNLSLVLLTEFWGLHYLLSAIVATQVSTTWNFGFTETWVFGDRGGRWHWLQRLGMFLLINNIALAARGPLIFVLTSGLDLHYVLSNIISIVAMTFIRYTSAAWWIWHPTRSSSRLEQSFPRPKLDVETSPMNE